jgi:hypothetical protein
MNLPSTLPDWLPWWLALAIAIPVAIYVLALLAMPFSVFGVKGRLEGVEARLDEIQGEIRALSLRLREPAGGDMAALPPPIPPSPDEPPPRSAAQRARAEPRLDWPRRAPT